MKASPTRRFVSLEFLNAGFVLLVFAAFTFGQLNFGSDQPDGGGSAPLPSDAITDVQREAIWGEINRNRARLEKEGLLAPVPEMVTLFKWPITKSPGAPGFHVEGISNYVDQNLAFPNQLLDYNCGARTYDQNNGYNHRGIDIFTWPFGWRKMDNSEALIVAAAPGTIVFKSDGNQDRSCSFNGLNWNAVYVQHADGSIAWYGHMKNGSTISKPVGATVTAGEVLGIVGSSGNSTGPHLHFEIYNASNQLVEPYQGTCNSMNAVSWWEAQEPYRNSRMNRLMTHSAAPGFPSCPTTVETINDRNYFRPGQSFIVAGYFRDATSGQQTQYTLFRPDGDVSNTWSHNSPNTYNASYWFWTFGTNESIMQGQWRVRAVFNGQEYNHYFTVSGRTPFDYDGDSKSDYSVWRPSDGTWYLALSQSASMYVQPWGQATDKIAPADYDGDGVTDMAVYRPSEGKWYVIYSQSATINAISFGLDGDVPLPQDFDGDGKADFGIWRPSDGTWYLGLSQTGSMYVLPFGLSTDKPVPADFDGDGKVEIAVWRPSEGRWYVGNIFTGGFSTYDWGLNGDMPVVGDYSGDGKADYAVYRPSNQTWYRVHTDGFAVVEKQWGAAGDIPAPGDFDGDGKLDIATYRPSEGRWYVWTATNTPLSQLFGLNGDVPTESAFVY